MLNNRHRTAVIRSCDQRDRDPNRPAGEQKVCLFTQDGERLLGRHPDTESAKAQEAAIHARGGSKRKSMSRYIKLAEVPEATIKSLYDEQWGQGIMKALGDDAPVDAKSAQFLFFTVWNGVVQLMDKVLIQQMKVDTTKFAQDPTFMQSLVGLAYFVADDAIKKQMGIASNSLAKGTGHAEALMAVLGQEAPVDKTLEGLAAQAAPIADKAFEQMTQWLGQQPAAKPATEPEQKAASVAKPRDQFVAWVRQVEAKQLLTTDEVMQYYRDADETAVAELVTWYNNVRPQDHQEFLQNADKVLGNHGVEALNLRPDAERWQLEYDEAIIADYSNTGDNYHPTFLLDIEIGEMLWTSWADFLERWEQERTEEIEAGGPWKAATKPVPGSREAKKLSEKQLERRKHQGDEEDLEQDDLGLNLDDLVAKDLSITAAAPPVADPEQNSPKHVDRLVTAWAQELPRHLTGQQSVWLYPVVRVGASDAEWLEAVEREGLYIPPQNRDVPYLQEYLQEQMNDQLITKLNSTAVSKVGSFVYAEQDGVFGLLYWTPAVEDLLRLGAKTVAEKSVAAVTKPAVLEPEVPSPTSTQEFIKFAGHQYRETTFATAPPVADPGFDGFLGISDPEQDEKRRATEQRHRDRRHRDRDGMLGMGPITVTEDNLEDVHEQIGQDLVPGCVTWGIIYEDGQRGQMVEYPDGRGYVTLGADPDWGEWRGDLLYLDDGESVYNDEGEEVLSGRDRDSRAPTVQLTQQVGKLPRPSGERQPEKPPVDSKVQQFFKWLRKKSHEASARGHWGRLADYHGCGPTRTRQADQVLELPTDCVAEVIGVQYSNAPTTLFEQKGGSWFVEGIDTKGVVDDHLVQMLTSYCEMATTANTRVVTVVRYWWDDQDPGNEGWYYKVTEDGEFVDDSMKAWAPVDADSFGQDEEGALVDALQQTYPGASVTTAGTRIAAPQHYCIVNDIAIWGLGRSCEEAQAVVEDGMREPIEVVEYYSGPLGSDFVCLPCTEELYRNVELEGGDIAFDVQDGVLQTYPGASVTTAGTRIARMSHDEAIKVLRQEGYPVNDNPDLLDSLHSTSPLMPSDSARQQERYWQLRGREDTTQQETKPMPDYRQYRGHVYREATERPKAAERREATTYRVGPGGSPPDLMATYTDFFDALEACQEMAETIAEEEGLDLADIVVWGENNPTIGAGACPDGDDGAYWPQVHWDPGYEDSEEKEGREHWRYEMEREYEQAHEYDRYANGETGTVTGNRDRQALGGDRSTTITVYEEEWGSDVDAEQYGDLDPAGVQDRYLEIIEEQLRALMPEATVVVDWADLHHRAGQTVVIGGEDTDLDSPRDGVADHASWYDTIDYIRQSAWEDAFDEPTNRLAYTHYRQALEGDQPSLPKAYEETIVSDPDWSSMGKFDQYADEVVYGWGLDGMAAETLGEADTFGYYELHNVPGGAVVQEPDGREWTFASAIVNIDSRGFVNVTYFDTIEEGQRTWDQLETEYSDWSDKYGDDQY